MPNLTDAEHINTPPQYLICQVLGAEHKRMWKMLQSNERFFFNMLIVLKKCLPLQNCFQQTFFFPAVSGYISAEAEVLTSN